MLALLMARAGEPVSLPEIVDTMWGQEPPDTAVNAVHRNVGMLRRALEPQLAARSPGQWLIRSAGGYRLDVDADTLDLLRFRQLVRQARTAAADGQATEMVRLFTEALELWQGNGPGGIDPRVRHHPTFTAIDREYLAAAREAGDVALTTVASDRLLAEVRRAADQAPFDEPLQARLLLALATAGHQADALDIYQKMRSRLAEELGLDPGPELTAAHEAALQQTLHVGKPRTPSGHTQPAKKPTRDAPGQLTAQLATHPTQLPADLPTFTGRRAELAQALALQLDATSPGTVVISAIGGMAGIGKTTFAVHWAHQVAHRFPDGQLYVNLRGFEPSGEVMGPGEALQHMVGALGVPRQEIPTGLDAQAALYRSRIAGRRMLILLDNARDAEQVRPLLPGSPGCLVIVTSRNDLAGLVATSGAHPLPLGMLSAPEARDFLSRRIGASRVAAEPDAVDEIIASCAGLPLALAIVTARIATHPGFALGAVAAELRETYGTLDAFVGTEAVTNVRTVFSWSYRALPPAAARLFRLLGLHPGPDITAPAAASLAGLSVRHVRPLLAELTHAHLLTEQVPGRYTCHDLLRVYAAELTEDDLDARQGSLHRILDHYLHTAHKGDALLTPNRDPILLTDPQDGVIPEPLADLPHAFAWFAAEEQVILAAVGQAVAHGFDRHAWQLAWAANSYLQRRSSPDSMLALQTTATQAALRDGNAAAYARNLNGLAIACAQAGQLDQAYEHLLQALKLFVELGDVRGQTRTRQNLTHTVIRQGKPQEALHHARKALALCRTSGDRMGQARALGAMGWALTRLGEHREALRYCRQARPVLAEFGDATGEAAAAHSAGHAHHHLGEYAEAVDHYQQAITLSRRSGDHNYEAMVLDHLGDTQQAAGDPNAARATWELALTTIRDPDHPTAQSVRAKLDDVPRPDGLSSAT